MNKIRLQFLTVNFFNAERSKDCGDGFENHIVQVLDVPLVLLIENRLNDLANFILIHSLPSPANRDLSLLAGVV